MTKSQTLLTAISGIGSTIIIALLLLENEQLAETAAMYQQMHADAMDMLIRAAFEEVHGG